MRDLVEKVVVAMDETYKAALRRGMWKVSREHDYATAAIAVVLEEAARVAEAFPAHTHGNLASAPPQAAEQAADEIAAATRALADDGRKA